MNKLLLTLCSSFFAVTISQAAIVGVVDSGTDFEHSLLKARALQSTTDILGNRVDDDRNGKVDDVFGWNFVENFSTVFYPAHIKNINPIAYKLLEIVARIQGGNATPEDKKYWEAYVTHLSAPQKELLLKHLNFFGQYAHGTHVAGIVAMKNPQSKIMSMRVFPDEMPDRYSHPLDRVGFMSKAKEPIFGWATGYLYKLIAYFQSMIFAQVSDYHKEKKVDVANYSLGVPLQMIAKALLAAQGVSTPTPEQLSQETVKAYKEFEPRGIEWMKRAEQTLFVVAAGNDGTDNDLFPTFPSNIRLANQISVAAIGNDGKLASFSNYGLKSVDIAAPGVAIMSSVPSLDKKGMLPMSGTSMAAPYVTGVASMVKDINPNLTGWMIREILMGTVDYRDELKGKVVSGGAINPERAYLAAELSKASPLDQAITASRANIADIQYTKVKAEKDQSTPMLNDLAEKLVF